MSTRETASVLLFVWPTPAPVMKPCGCPLFVPMVACSLKMRPKRSASKSMTMLSTWKALSSISSMETGTMRLVYLYAPRMIWPNGICRFTSALFSPRIAPLLAVSSTVGHSMGLPLVVVYRRAWLRMSPKCSRRLSNSSLKPVGTVNPPAAPGLVACGSVLRCCNMMLRSSAFKPSMPRIKNLVNALRCCLSRSSCVSSCCAVFTPRPDSACARACCALTSAMRSLRCTAAASLL